MGIMIDIAEECRQQCNWSELYVKREKIILMEMEGSKNRNKYGLCCLMIVSQRGG